MSSNAREQKPPFLASQNKDPHILYFQCLSQELTRNLRYDVCQKSSELGAGNSSLLQIKCTGVNVAYSLLHSLWW